MLSPTILTLDPPPGDQFVDLDWNHFPSHRGMGGRRTAPTSNRLPNRPPASRKPKDTGSSPPLNQQSGSLPKETDPILQSLAGLIVCSLQIFVVIIL